MSKQPIILFDVMETLVTEPFFTAVPAFFGMTLDELLAAKHPTSWIEFEKGRISEAEYLEQFFHDGRPIDCEALRQCLTQAYRWIDGMEDLLEELMTAGFELHALSNYSLWYKLIDGKFRLTRFLHWTFVSCLTGVRKPDPQAYLGAVEALGVEPADCLFIDDRPQNIQAAVDVGLDAILMCGASELRGELVQRQMLPFRASSC